VTTNKNHPAYGVNAENMRILYQDELDLSAMLEALKDYGCARLTVQSGGTLNGLFLREKLFDFVDIVVAPVLVGGKNTSTLIDGESLTSVDELSKIGVLELEKAETLQNSYLRLRYKVIS
jgi:2,5-diamino-6-(ribosylamino)-4(3H)-pyrimidinone 5'-phosphate reductase